MSIRSRLLGSAEGRLSKLLKVSDDYVKNVMRPEKGIQTNLTENISGALWNGRINIGGGIKSFLLAQDRSRGLYRGISSTGRIAVGAGLGVYGVAKTANWLTSNTYEKVFNRRYPMNPQVPVGAGRRGITNTRLAPANIAMTNLSMMNYKRNRMRLDQYRRGARFI